MPKNLRDANVIRAYEAPQGYLEVIKAKSTLRDAKLEIDPEQAISNWKGKEPIVNNERSLTKTKDEKDNPCLDIEAVKKAITDEKMVNWALSYNSEEDFVFGEESLHKLVKDDLKPSQETDGKSEVFMDFQTDGSLVVRKILQIYSVDKRINSLVPPPQEAKMSTGPILIATVDTCFVILRDGSKVLREHSIAVHDEKFNQRHPDLLEELLVGHEIEYSVSETTKRLLRSKMPSFFYYVYNTDKLKLLPNEKAADEKPSSPEQITKKLEESQDSKAKADSGLSSSIDLLDPKLNLIENIEKYLHSLKGISCILSEESKSSKSRTFEIYQDIKPEVKTEREDKTSKKVGEFTIEANKITSNEGGNVVYSAMANIMKVALESKDKETPEPKPKTEPAGVVIWAPDREKLYDLYLSCQKVNLKITEMRVEGIKGTKVPEAELLEYMGKNGKVKKEKQEAKEEKQEAKEEKQEAKEEKGSTTPPSSLFGS